MSLLLWIGVHYNSTNNHLHILFTITIQIRLPAHDINLKKYYAYSTIYIIPYIYFHHQNLWLHKMRNN